MIYSYALNLLKDPRSEIHNHCLVQKFASKTLESCVYRIIVDIVISSLCWFELDNESMRQTILYEIENWPGSEVLGHDSLSLKGEIELTYLSSFGGVVDPTLCRGYICLFRAWVETWTLERKHTGRHLVNVNWCPPQIEDICVRCKLSGVILLLSSLRL